MDAAKAYLYEKKIPQLFEGLMAALMYHKPDDHIAFLQECLAQASAEGGEYRWKTFLANGGDGCASPARAEARLAFSNTQPLPPIAPEISSNAAGVGPQTSNPIPPPAGDGGSGSSEEEGKAGEGVSEVIGEGEIKKGREEEEGKQENLRQGLSNRPIIFVLGAPGSGKGTHCTRVVEDFGFTHLSAGDLLREEVAKGGERGEEVVEIMKQGKLVPGELMVGLLKSAILSHPHAHGFLIDGFPRDLKQGQFFTQQVCECTRVIVFECSEEVLVRRLLARGATSGRVDDNEETIKKRFNNHQEATVPVIQHYHTLDMVTTIDSERSVEEVYADVHKFFTDITAKQSSSHS